MRLWLSKSSEVPLREQLVTQIILGVASSDLAEGERLPSTRELARRYKIHSNTVSAAYRELAQRGWVEFRKGSGVYVKTRGNVEPGLDLDDLISTFFKATRDRGYSLAQVQAGLKRWTSAQPPDHFLVIEPDDELREILAIEIGMATGKQVIGASFDSALNDELSGAVPVLMQTHLDELQSLLPTGKEAIAMRARSVPETVRDEKVPTIDTLITVVSRWPGFLQRARAFLVAAGLDPVALTFKDAREQNWSKGVSASSLVISDSLMANQLPSGCKARVFRIISDASIKELRHAAEGFAR
jgi:GntR family transcriptional regulator